MNHNLASGRQYFLDFVCESGAGAQVDTNILGVFFELLPV